MADIFLSYAEEDRQIAGKVAGLLEAHGWSVWWDRRIPAGRTWRAVIEEALHGMSCMVVLWSTSSIDSEWVKEEAEEGRARGKLVPILIERVIPPLGLRGIQAADLTDWDGGSQAPGVRHLMGDLEAMIGAPGPQAPPPEASAELDAQAAAEISALRRKLIVAATANDIQQLLYEVEAFLARRPLDVEGRALRDDIRRALAPPPRGAAAASPATPRRFRPAAAWLSVAVAAPLLLIMTFAWQRADTPLSPGGTAALPAPPASESRPPVPTVEKPAPTVVEKPALRAGAEADRPIVANVPAPAKSDHVAKSHNKTTAKPARCAAILERATLGETLTADDRAFLKREC